ncbi:MAG: hypothetical protein PG981_000596 [Wolbachia endosymbiont of Ctenocephalides orientis wCori]|nr:MAG: hypothetical protein PG981_000596 [Wolbachia endosymbiont of Ctenocephalides orientis wCori]
MKDSDLAKLPTEIRDGICKSLTNIDLENLRQAAVPLP